jgi:hypothetical protein
MYTLFKCAIWRREGEGKIIFIIILFVANLIGVKINRSYLFWGLPFVIVQIRV